MAKVFDVKLKWMGSGANSSMSVRLCLATRGLWRMRMEVLLLTSRKEILTRKRPKGAGQKFRGSVCPRHPAVIDNCEKDLKGRGLLV